MDDAPSLLIGLADGDHLSVTPLRRKYPEHSDYWDGNWLEVAIDVSVGGLGGRVAADLRAEELARLRETLRRLRDELGGSGAFETMEHWLTIRLTGDGRGHFQAECELRDVSRGSRLLFEVAFDQTELPAMVRELDGIVAAFPVRGRP